MQSTLFSAQGDVLILLDCCHATIKSRGFTQGQMEILAACASGSRVPKPGRLSFTSVLIREIRKQLKAGKTVPVRWLHAHLWADNTYPSLTRKRFHTLTWLRDAFIANAI